MPIHEDFSLVPIPPIPTPPAGPPTLLHGIPQPMRPVLGPLALLPGVWKGHGLNQIWRPFHGSQDRFLELNLTTETLEFTIIPGEIPNRGLLQPDIVLHGMTYLQQVQDANVKGPNGKPAGIHIEPGIWVSVPSTTAPSDLPTVARLATIPHGTSIVAQGVATTIAGPPVFPVASITPFFINNPLNLRPFPESNLAIPAPGFRSPPADIVGITQAMVDNPNGILAVGIAEKTITSTTALTISTEVRQAPVPSSGGGTSNIAFLAGSVGGPNAVAAQVDATFWIETFTDHTGKIGHQLQYTQRVLLSFNGLSWPHLSVATLRKQ
ncbi:MAG: heme-binding protein [Byssovorax sp.]